MNSNYPASSAQSYVPPNSSMSTVTTVRMAGAEGRREVVLVDTSLADYKSLEAGVRDDVGIVEFDGGGDGLAQIAQWAAGQHALNAIHILSHGARGLIKLGTTQLTEAALSSPTTQAQLAQLGQALASDGDLLLYGCGVAAGDSAGLLASLAQATGADVAASTDLTGAARLGGNWTLEAHSGVIDAGSLALTQYDGALLLLPPATTVTSAILSSDTGASASDFITHTAAQTIMGTLSANLGSGESVQVSYDNGSTWADATTYAVGSSTWSTTTTLSGSDTFMARVANSGGASAAYMHTYTVDTTAPTVSLSNATLAPDTGISPNDFLTRFTNVTVGATLSGTLAAGESVYGSVNGGGTWTDITSSVAGATLTWNGVNLASSGTLKLKVQDAAGNDGSVLSRGYMVDTIAPTNTVTSIALSNDSGASSTDFITNAPAQTISGTLSAGLASDEWVYVSLNNGGTWTTAAITIGSTVWSLSGVTLAGSDTLRVMVSDAAGNSSPVATRAYTIDTTAPAISFSNLALSADTGASASDFITSIDHQTISATLSGALSVGDIVLGSVNGGSSWTDITSKVTGTNLAWDGVTLTGSGTLMLKVQDTAGNDSSTTSQAYTQDQNSSSTYVTSMALSNDSGRSSSDLITNIAAQTISGALSDNLAAGEMVYVSLDNGMTWTTAACAVGSNTWSLGGVTLAGTNVLWAKVTDVAGNDGIVLSHPYVFDATAPTISFGNVAFSADTGASASDFITSVAAQTIGATLSTAPAVGDIVFGSLDNGSTWTNITTMVSGNVLTWTGVMLDGSGMLRLKVQDAAGNDSFSVGRNYVLDTGTATPGGLALTAATDHGASDSDGITNVNTPTITGSAEDGSTVSIYDGGVLLGTTTAGAGGWSYTTPLLTNGSHVITAVATDAAGNTSATSGALDITVDTITPIITWVAVPADGTYYVGDSLNFMVDFTEPMTVDTVGGTPRIAIAIGTQTRYASYVEGSGSSTLVFRYVVQGGDTDTNGITVGGLSTNGGSLRDTAGNDATLTLNNPGSTAAVNVDGRVAGVTNVSASSANGSYGNGQTIAIVVSFSDAVTVDTTGGTPTLSLGGGGTATYAGGSGSNTLTFNYTVGAGQSSADLDYSSSSALALNGGTIVETARGHQPASLVLATPGTAGSLGANTAVVVDAVAPALPTATFSVAENSANGTAVGAATGTDQSALTYSLANSAGGRFAIDASSGAITVANGSLLDYEALAAHQVTVRATDLLGNFTDTVFTVNLTNVNDAPVVAVNTGVQLQTSSSKVITAAMLRVADQDNAAAEQVFTVQALPASGSLTLNGTALAIGGTFTQADIDAGKLSYASATTAGSTGFAFTVSDGAGGSIGQTSFSLTVKAPPPAPDTPPPVPPVTTTVDGVSVSTTTTTNADGSVSQTIYIPVVTSDRHDSVGGNSVADIPLVTSGGSVVLGAQVPVGFGLQVSGPVAPKTAGTSLADLTSAIVGHSAAGSGDQLALTGGGQDFLANVPAAAPLLVRTIVISAAPGAPASGEPLVISGNAADAGTLNTALVIDARGVPTGSVLQLQNVEFAAVIGAVTVTGGDGQQHVWGDSAAQTIVLGADNDVLHGGAGNDVIGSAGGDDLLDGGEGNDIVFGGIGNDTLLGGSGDDQLQGGRSDIGQWDFYLDSTGQVVGRHNTQLVNGAAYETLAASEMNTAVAELGFVKADQATLKTLSLLYHTAFKRAPDLAGLNFWAGHAVSTDQLVQTFLQSQEWAAGMGKLSNQELVQQLYQNMRGQPGSGVEVDQWVSKLDSNAISRADLVRAFALSSEHQAAWSTGFGMALGGENLKVEQDWIAGSGDDVLNGGAGNDILVGGDGTDTVVYDGKLADYKFLLSADGDIKVAEVRAGGDVDVIKQIEKAQFSDASIDLHFTQFSQSALQQVGMMYRTVLGRAGDLAGFSYWLDRSPGAVDMASSFVNSAEFLAHYGKLDDASFVRQLYQNATAHDPDAASLQNWAAYLASHTRGEMVAALSASAEIIGAEYGTAGLWIV